MKTILRSSLVLLAIFFLPFITFSQSEKKVVYGILIDNTGTMRTQFEAVQTFSKGVVREASERGIISLFSFETQTSGKNPLAVVASGTQWSQDKNTLEKHITDLTIVIGQTVLFDSIQAIAKNINAKAKSDSSSEKIIILITDGEDRASVITEKQLLKELRDSGVKVYVVGLLENLNSDGGFTKLNNPQLLSKDFLKKIAKETGGNVIFPKLKKNTKVEDLLTGLFAEQAGK